MRRSRSRSRTRTYTHGEGTAKVIEDDPRARVSSVIEGHCDGLVERRDRGVDGAGGERGPECKYSRT